VISKERAGGRRDQLRIENYLGFPLDLRPGAGGSRLRSAQKFGTKISLRERSPARLQHEPYACSAARLPRSIAHRAIIIASGVEYRRWRLRTCRASRAPRCTTPPPDGAQLCAMRRSPCGGANSLARRPCSRANREAVHMLIRVTAGADHVALLISRIEAIRGSSYTRARDRGSGRNGHVEQVAWRTSHGPVRSRTFAMCSP